MRRLPAELLVHYKAQSLRPEITPSLRQLHTHTAKTIQYMLDGVNRKFNKVCIHSEWPWQILHGFNRHALSFNKEREGDNQGKGTVSNNSIQKHKADSSQDNIALQNDLCPLILPADIQLTIVSCCAPLVKPPTPHQFIQLGSWQQWIDEDHFQQFDLIISDLQINKCSKQLRILEKYQRSLKADGALVGCTFAQQTLTQLHWCYLMAQNQRYGGLSPKIASYSPSGQLGTLLHAAHYTMATVVPEQIFVQIDSPLDAIRYLQEIGESCVMGGRRKGVFKDLLVAAAALYQTQFPNRVQGMVEKVMLAKAMAEKKVNQQMIQQSKQTQNKLESETSLNKQSQINQTDNLSLQADQYAMMEICPIEIVPCPQSYSAQNKLGSKIHDLIEKNFNSSQLQNKVPQTQQIGPNLTLSLSNFLCWKYSPKQPKPKSRMKTHEALTFEEELRRVDSQMKIYQVNDDGDLKEEDNEDVENGKPKRS